MLNKLQRLPYIQSLPSARSRALLTGLCLTFTRATRAIWEDFRAKVEDAASTDSLGTADTSYFSPSPPAKLDSVPVTQPDTASVSLAVASDLICEGDFG